MMMIVQFVIVQNRKSDRYRLRSRNSDNACKLRILKFFASAKNENANKDGNSNGCLVHCDLSTSDPTTNALVLRSSDPFPLPQACLAPVENLATPAFLDTTAKEDAGKNGCCGDEENGQYRNGSKPRDSLIAIKPPPLVSFQTVDVGDKDLCTGAGDKPRAPPSRSAKGNDSYHFNAVEVRARIRRESLVALDTQEPNDAKGKHCTHEELQGRLSTNRESQLCQQSNNRGLPHGRATTISTLALHEDGENDDGENDDGDNNSPTNSVETEAIFQALLYAGCFFLTYIFSVAVSMIQMQGKEVPFALLFLARFFLPLQGSFHIVIYTRPHIISLQRNNPEYSWFKAFRVVFKAGGDNDSVGQVQRRPTSQQPPASNTDIRRRQKLVERDHNRRMEDIKRRSTVSGNFVAGARQVQEADEEQSAGNDDSAAVLSIADEEEEIAAKTSSSIDNNCFVARSFIPV